MTTERGGAGAEAIINGAYRDTCDHCLWIIFSEKGCIAACCSPLFATYRLHEIRSAEVPMQRAPASCANFPWQWFAEVMWRILGHNVE